MKLILIIIICGVTMAKYPVKDYYNGSRFNNFPIPEGEEKGFSDFLKWQLSGERSDWPDHVPNQNYPAISQPVQDDQVLVTWVGHSTFLLQFKEYTILTDPIWSQRCSPSQLIGPSRVRAPGIEFEKLPKIDLVIVSHNHYDHMDTATLRNLSQKFRPPILVPLGDAYWLNQYGVREIEEMDWWQEKDISEDIKIVMTPAQHFSGRGFFDRNKSLWGSFVIRYKGKNIYFGGDAGYSIHYKNIRNKLGDFHLSLLPIGAYEPRWFMKTMHMNPEEAVRAHLDLSSQLSIGMHFGTFQLTDESIDAPVKALKKAKEDLQIKDDTFTVIDVGQSILVHL